MMVYMLVGSRRHSTRHMTCHGCTDFFSSSSARWKPWRTIRPDVHARMNMSSIVLYVELLSNIGQVTAFTTLPSDSDLDTSAGLSADGRSLSITHGGSKVGVRLPCKVLESPALRLPFAVGTKEFSLRLQVARDASQNVQGDEDVPWSASHLTSDSRITCLVCNQSFLGVSSPIWKDLPSENWAEMMDFWHCHKPNNEEDLGAQGQGLAKGYAASNQLAPSRGVGLVDISNIILVKSDCSGIQVCLARTIYAVQFRVS